jgi:sulfoxide reductase heme-binding subunit YedZ
MVLGRELWARWLQLLTHVAALLPLAWLVWAYWQGLFVVDPVRQVTTRTGRTALILLILSLACTPISAILGFKQALRLRRPLGLYAAVYVGLHFLTFVGLDYGFDLELLRLDITYQRYVLVGFASGLLLLPLTITSTRGWQKRLGRNWKRLHRLVYLAAILDLGHFMWLVKDLREPLRYGVVLLILLMARLPAVEGLAGRLRSPGR